MRLQGRICHVVQEHEIVQVKNFGQFHSNIAEGRSRDARISPSYRHAKPLHLISVNSIALAASAMCQSSLHHTYSVIPEHDSNLVLIVLLHQMADSHTLTQTAKCAASSHDGQRMAPWI